MDIVNTVNVLIVSDSYEGCQQILSNIFSNVSSSDNQEWIEKIDDFSIKTVIKYIGNETCRQDELSCLDILIAGCLSEDPNLINEIENYFDDRSDTRHKIWFSLHSLSKFSKLGSIYKKMSSLEIKELIVKYITELQEFNNTYNSYADTINHIIPSNSLKEYFITELGYNQSDFNYVLRYYKNFDYQLARRFFCAQSKNMLSFSTYSFRRDQAYKYSDIIEQMLNEISNHNFANFFSLDSNSLIRINYSANDPEGIAFIAKLITNEEFKQRFLLLPLIIRENMISISAEVKPKNPNDMDKLYKALKACITTLESFNLNKTLAVYGMYLSIRRTESSIFFDITCGGLVGDFINSKFRLINIDLIGAGIYICLEILTGISLESLLNEVNQEKLLLDLYKTNIGISSRLLNINTIIDMLIGSNFLNFSKNTKLALRVLKLLFTVKRSNVKIDIKNESDDEILKFCKEMSHDYGGFLKKIKIVQEKLKEVVNVKKEHKAFICTFLKDFNLINYNRITIQVIAPAIQSCLETTLIVPGLSELIDKVLFSL